MSTIRADSVPGDQARPQNLKDEQIELREDEDDPEVWEIVNSFARSPSKTNTKKAMQILDQKMTDWTTHPAGLVTTILGAIGEHHVQAGRTFLFRYLEIDLQRESAEFITSSAALALGELGGPGALDALKRAASYHSDETVASVAVALGVLADPQSVPILEGLAVRGTAQVRHRALDALAKYCAATSRSVAVQALTDGDGAVRNSATWWIAQCGAPQDGALLAQCLVDPDELIRSNALKGLQRLGSKSGCEMLVHLLADESLTVRQEGEHYKVICDNP